MRMKADAGRKPGVDELRLTLLRALGGDIDARVTARAIMPTLRMLAARCSASHDIEESAADITPRQVGFYAYACDFMNEALMLLLGR